MGRVGQVRMVQIKSPNYYSGFQPKRRRRRECKTDYKARGAMIRQDLKKYGAKKYRFIVRITNNRIICQIAYATLEGDRIVASADSGELAKYGKIGTVGLTNFAAAYATGLLCARRVLAKFGIADQFVGQTEVDGKHFLQEDTEEGRRPLSAVLDIGLRRSTKGARVFGAMKGAVDGGVHIPHSDKCLPGDEGEEDVCLERILGGHVSLYMSELKEGDEDKYKLQFGNYIKAGVEGDSLEAMYKQLHADIRKDPSPSKEIITARRAANKKSVQKKVPKLNAQQKRDRVQMKLAKLAEMMA